MADLIRQPGVDLIQKRKVYLLPPQTQESWFVCNWTPSAEDPRLGHLWAAIQPSAVRFDASIHHWDMHLTLFNANYVRQPTDALVSRLRARTRRDFFAYGFKATESPVVELTTAGAWRHRVLVYLCVNTNLHNACHSIRFALKNSVWDYARSQCTRTEELRYNFHLSLD